MKKTLVSLVSFAVVALVTLGIAMAGTIVWPLSSTPRLNIAMPSGYEPSGLAYNGVTKKLFTVSDGGQITVMNLDGTSQVTKSVGGDNEAITIKDPNSSKIYIGIEQPDSIVEYDVNTWEKGTTWDLTSVMTGSDNSGLEGLTFVPNGYHPFPDSTSGGVFYAGIQRSPIRGDGNDYNNYLIYVFDIDLNSTTGRIVNWWGIPVADGTPNGDISDMYFSKETGVLYVLYDGYDRLIEMTTDGKVLKDYSGIPLPAVTGQAGDEQEGVLVLPNDPYSSTNTADIYFAYDHPVRSSGISKFTGYEINFDVDGDGVMNNTDCAVNDKNLGLLKTYYQDLDGDGLGSDVVTSVCSLTPPAGYVTNSDDLNDNDYYNNDKDGDGVVVGVDCNDNDKTVWALQTYYQDLDKDGLGSDVATSVCSLSIPTGYVTNSDDLNDNDYDNDGVSTGVDCNDKDKTVSVLKTYYQDLDGDSLGSDVSTSVCSLSVPAGYVVNSDDLNDNDFDNDGVSTGVDCNDKDKTVSVLKTYYQDLDGDGLGADVSTSVCSLAVPAGYVVNSDDLNDNDFDNDGVSTGVDCNDKDKTISALQIYYQDLDKDGLGSDVATSVCSLSIPVGYVINSDDLNDNDYDNDGVSTGVDCNDKDKTISALQIYYQDLDKDGLGSDVSTSVCSLAVPTEYVVNSDDLNDNDFDNDGVSTGVDCNDKDKTVSALQVYYQDLDKDGLGSDVATSVCSLSIPTEYVTNSDDLNDNDYDNDGVSTGVDCNDNNPLLSTSKVYYIDVDGDGLGSARKSVSVCSLTPPVGYVANSMDKNDSDFDNDGVSTKYDCNDKNPLYFFKRYYYYDGDGDGLGNRRKKIYVCVPPAGYVLNSKDKNDNDYDNDGVSPPLDPNDKDPNVPGAIRIISRRR